MQTQGQRLFYTGFPLILFLISGIEVSRSEHYIPMGTEASSRNYYIETYYDTTKRDEYLKPINARLSIVLGTNQRLSNLIKTNNADTTAKKLILADLYREYFELEQSRKELISEYYQLQAKRDELKNNAEAWRALKHLVDLAVQAPLDLAVRNFITSYLEKDKEDRVLAIMELNAFMHTEQDVAQKAAFTSLRDVLNGSVASAVGESGVEGLRLLTSQNAAGLAAIAGFVQTALDGGALDFAKVEQDIELMRQLNEGSADFSRIDELSAKVFELERQVTHNTDYSAALNKEIAESSAEIAALKAQQAKAPKSVKSTRRVSVY